MTHAPPSSVDAAGPAWGLDAPSIAARLAALPGVQRVPSPKLSLFVCRDFLDPETCARLRDAVDATRRPSTVADCNGDTSFRTSETGDLDPLDPLTAWLNDRISVFTGLDPAHGEPIQGQRYAVGQEFKPHTDTFEPTSLDFDRNCRIAGNRTWTVMIYLNRPDAGGATRFKAIDKIIQPETGKLLAWDNRRPDGSLNAATLHHGMKVRAGTKYIVTKWFRERAWR